MSYPNMKCMYVTIWVHHMQVDEMFDFLTGRTEDAPPYWYNHDECPLTVTGGYAALTLAYDQFSNLRSKSDWADPFSGHNNFAAFLQEREDVFGDWDEIEDVWDGLEEWDRSQDPIDPTDEDTDGLGHA